MERQASISPEPADRPDNCHIVEVTGQVRGVQMRPPGDGDGGEFQLLLDSGDTIVSLYPAEWHLEVASNLQANYMLGAKVRGIGEYSPKASCGASGKSNRLTRSGSLIGKRRFYDTATDRMDTSANGKRHQLLSNRTTSPTTGVQ